MTKKLKKDTEDFYDEAFEGPGFLMARKGRHIIMKSTYAPEEHSAFLKVMKDSLGQTEESIQAKVKEIQTLIQDHNPLDIIARVSLRNSSFDAEKFKEYELKINPAYTEYIALLCLSQPYEFFHYQNPEPISDEFIETLQEKVKNLFQAEIMYLLFKDVDPDKPINRTTIDRLRFESLSNSLMVRYSAYQHHQIEVLIGVFSPLEKEMERTLGFNISDAISILDGIESLHTLKLVHRWSEANHSEQKLRKAVKDYRHRKENTKFESEFPEALLDKLAKEKSKVSVKMIRDMVAGWTFYALEDTISFTEDELAKLTGLEPEKITNFLGKFSIRFGEVDARYQRPAPTHPLMQRPFIKHEAKYWCPVLQSTYWAFRPLVEELWNPQSKINIVSNDTAIWQIYQKTRATYVEETALKYLSNTLKFSKAYHGLKYDLFNDKEEKIEAELDGLLILDNAIFLMEVKSGNLSEQARRGAKKGMKDDVERLVEEAYAQALRAKSFIQNSEKPTFRLSNNKKITIDKSKINEIYLITVSLDDLSVFVTNTHLLHDLGFLQSHEYPWAISLTDLKIISEIVEFSSQLVHYIKRRIHLIDLEWVNAHDELDWFGHYILEGLYFDNLKKDKNDKFVYNLLSYSWIFDDYYFYVTGQRQNPVEKPKQDMPKAMREILSELDYFHDPGYLKVACTLMDMSGETRQELFKVCQKLKMKSLRDREIHSYTIPFVDGDFGFAFFFLPYEQRHRFPNYIANYSLLKKYQTKLYNWVTVACIVDTSRWVDYFVVMEGPWEFDEILDKEAKEYLQPWDESGK